jgi:hypothetical protein
MKKLNETIVNGTAVCKLKPLPLAGHILNQCNVAFFGDVDCDEVRRRCRVILVNH